MNILLTGAISLSNKGTAGTVISVITQLKKTFPNSKIYVELFYPKKQAKIMNIEKEYNVSVVAPPLQSPFKAVIMFFVALSIMFFRKLGLNSPNFEILGNYANVDVIIEIGGEGFVKFYGENFIQTSIRFLLHLYPIFIGLLLGKPIVLLAQSLAPFGAFRIVMRYVIKNSALVTVRDPTSIENLKKEAIDVSKIHLTADFAFLLGTASNNRVSAILKSEGIDPDIFKRRKVIGICAGKILKPDQHELLIKVLAEVADFLIEKYNAAVVFIPHSSEKIRRASSDILVGMSIMKNVKNKNDFYLIRGDYVPQEIKGILGKLDCLISLRMHPVIFASSMKVPCVIIAFNPKAYGLMEMLRLNNNVIYVGDVQAELLVNRILNCLSDCQRLKNTLGSVLPLINERALLNMQLLSRVIHEE